MTNNIRIAITGGIGSGKSYVCGLLKERGINVYDCDAAAKRIMATDSAVQQQLDKAVGMPVFIDGILQKPILAKFILASEDNKQLVNDIVHPAVAADFMASGLSWLESAILFEACFDKRINFDAVVCVTAPVETRIQRIMSRDLISRQQAKQWIDRQISQDEVAQRSDFVIVNDGLHDIGQQLDDILHKIDILQKNKVNNKYKTTNINNK